jgi:hypothetical protein
MTTHTGGCHCGRVRFEVDAPDDLEVTDCNCSICRMSGYLHLFVSTDSFRLISGEDDVEIYTFNTGVAQHIFCRHCGIKSYYVPRSHPDGVSINVNCLDLSTVKSQRVTRFDGQSWEENIHKVSPISD